MAGDFITCENRQHLSVEDLFKMLLLDDGAGCPQLNVNVGGGSLGAISFDFELNCVIDTTTDIVYLMRVKEEEDGTITIDYINAQGAVVVPPNPANLVICNSSEVLQNILIELQGINSELDLTHNTVSTSAAGNVPAGARRGSVMNIGANAGTWNGISIPAGVTIPFGECGHKGVYGQINYDATGTTFLIEYTTGN